MLRPDVAMSEPANRAETELRQVATIFYIGPILFLYYEESLASSNLNPNYFHCAHPNVGTYVYALLFEKKPFFKGPYFNYVY